MLALVSVLGAWLKEPSPGPDAASAAAISQRHDQPKAYALAYTRQVMWRPAANQLPAPVAIDRIFWLHVPKCGSSFTHTIFHYACARSVSWSCGNSVHHPPPDYCGTNRSTIQEQMHGGNYHTPIRWVQGMGGRFEPRANVGNVVAVFRSPAQRLLSAFSYMKQMPFCCVSDWGMGPANGYKRASVLKMPDAATLARLPYSQGCMTKMIIGFRCFENHTLAGTVPAAGSKGACTCWEVASGDGGGGGALQRAAWGVGRRARGHASGKAAVGGGGGEGGGVVAGGGERLRCGGCWGGGGEYSPEPPRADPLPSGGRTRGGGGGGAGWGAGKRVSLRPSVVLHLAGVEGCPGGGGQRGGRLLARRRGGCQR